MAPSLASTAGLPSCAARRGGRCVARRASAVAAPATATATARTHYEVLGVGAGASRCEIKAAYRRLAREVHPDCGGRGDEGFIRLHAAYATLADPDERARYDRAAAVRSRIRAAPSGSGAGFRPRRWETDQCW
uniref:Chaperone protein dnaJ 11 n=1 Tax=Zea mays TaxID=4577 RepID=B6SUM8_MAIZE|nr:chaperone protein dnaJ 11 [Zea mays]ACG30639.1 chaperone protein dnaJ 11 [Zea mays]